MSCGCKKKGEELRVTNVTLVEVTPQEIKINPIPQTPDELLAQELKKWNGGQQIINDNGEDIKTTSTDGTSE